MKSMLTALVTSIFVNYLNITGLTYPIHIRTIFLSKLESYLKWLHPMCKCSDTHTSMERLCFDHLFIHHHSILFSLIDINSISKLLVAVGKFNTKHISWGPWLKLLKWQSATLSHGVSCFWIVSSPSQLQIVESNCDGFLTTLQS